MLFMDGKIGLHCFLFSKEACPQNMGHLALVKPMVIKWLILMFGGQPIHLVFTDDETKWVEDIYIRVVP